MLHLLHVLWVTLGYTLLVVIGLLALWRGGTAERLSMAAITAAWLLTPLFQNKETHDLGLAVWIIDGSLTAFFMGVSLTTRRIWSLFAAAFMVNTMISHLINNMATSVDQFSYLTGVGFWGGIALILALGGGVWEREWLRRQSTSSA